MSNLQRTDENDQMTASRGIRAYRNRAVFRNHGPPVSGEVDPAIVAKCVGLWIECAHRANSRYGGVKPGNNKGRSAALRCPDDVLREHGITFRRDRREWANYERAIRAAAQGAR